MSFPTIDLSILSLKVGSQFHSTHQALSYYKPHSQFQYHHVLNNISVMISRIVNSIYRYAPLLWRSIRIQSFIEFCSRACKVMAWQMHFERKFVHQSMKKASTSNISFDELSQFSTCDELASPHQFAIFGSSSSDIFSFCHTSTL